MNTHFLQLVKIGFDLSVDKHGKKHCSGLPKAWNKITSSIYNNQENYAILTGEINDIIVIDLDIPKDSLSFIGLEWFIKQFGLNDISEMNTLVTGSFSGGYHVFFKYSSKIKNIINMNKLSIDILSDSKCVYQGKHYPIIVDTAIRELTDFEIDLFIPKKLKKLDLISKDTDLWFILDNLNESRFLNYDEWRNVGFSLLSQELGFELFDRFSQKSDKYNSDSVIQNWNTWKNTNIHGEKLTIASLYFYLKEDSPELFKQLKNEKGNVKSTNDSIINKLFTEEHTGGALTNIKYSGNSISANISGNNIRKGDHYTHNNFEVCKGLLKYNVDVNKKIENQISTSVLCNVCGYRHENNCVNNPIIYQIIVNNTIENIDELRIIIPVDLQLNIHINKIINNELYRSLKQGDLSICKILFELFKKDYLLIKNIWFTYTGTIWKEINEVIPKELLFGIQTINDLINELYYTHLDSGNLNDEQLKIILKITGNLSKKLEKNNEDLSFVNAAKKYFSQPDLVFNKNKHLLAFQNGIYDLNLLQFRKGLSEDYLNIQLDFDYNLDINPAKMQLIEKFFDDILPICSVKDFLLINISSCLLGIENKEQEFYILTGRKGANGKSVLTRFIEQLFGKYFSAPEPSLLTKQRERANEANEALIDLLDKRIAIISEPNKRDKILSDNLKKFTGGDTLSVRGNHRSTQRMKMDLKMFMLCNSIPLLDSLSDAEIRRLCIINFPNKFMENPKKKNEKLIDLNISDKLSECLNEFFHLLIRYLVIYKGYLKSGNKINKPKEVTIQLKEYIQKNKDDVDAYAFIEQFIEYKEGERLYCKPVWDKFREWCIEESKFKIKQNVLEELIENHFDINPKVSIKKLFCWPNLKLKEF